MMRRALLVMALVLTGALSGCTGADAGAQPAASTDVADVVTDLPPCGDQPETAAVVSDVSGLALDCLGGGTLDLTRAQGTPTVLNLWASWCGPCRSELPIIQQLADAAGGRLRVIGVDSKDGVPQATSFAADAGLTFPSAFDGPGDLATDLGLNGLPHSVFLTADGTVAYVEVGPVASLAELEGLVAEHLGVQL
jgi:thiol-disulfide isomerase/thioredoxin